MAPIPYVPLHVRSHYSLLYGASSVDEIAARAKALGLTALALTDDDNLYGLVPFLDAAQEAGVRPIVGARVTQPGGPAAVLLVRNRTGYENLCGILTQRHLAGEEGEPPFSLARALTASAEGLTVLTESATLAKALRGPVPPRRLWLELVRPGRSLTFQRRLARTARKEGLGLVASSDTAFTDPERHPLHRTLAAVRQNGLLADLTPSDAAHPGAFLPSPEEMTKRFADVPEALKNTLRAAEGCEGGPPGGRPIFPNTPLPSGETPASHLRRLAFEGLALRYRPCPPLAAARRLERELRIIEKLGFSPYFVVVGEIVRFARSRGIPVVGRGSGASSIVAYLLGITNVDPLRYRLYFERFLHERRADLPDLDVDLCWRGRDEVIDYVYRTYGRDRVAMISTHCRMRPRSAFRETAKAHGVPAATVDRLSRRIPYRPDVRLAEAIRLDPGASRAIPLDEEPFRTAVEEAQALEGFPRHLGIHCGGVVIADRPLDRYVPLERATKGIVITQLEMRAIERIGLVKFDLLGNRALTTLRETVRLTAEDRGETIDLEALPEEDEEAARLLCAGETLSCFQIESPAMRQLLTQLRVKDLAGVIDALSLVRPGPAGAGMKDAYIRRAHGAEPVTVLHERLAPILQERFGILLYEEDVMAVAAALTGGDLADGDLLRRAIKRAGGEARDRLQETFVAQAVRTGVGPKVARAAWAQLDQFAKYGFCRAHASGYGVLAWRSTLLKARYPVPYFCAIMNNHAGMYPSRVHLEEAKRMGVRVLPPCVNVSRDDFTTEGTDAIRVGLLRVQGLTERAREGIHLARRRRPFASLGDFLRRVPVAFKEAEALILAGAFGFTGRTRPELLYLLRVNFEGERREAKRGNDTLFAEDFPPGGKVRLKEYDPWTRLRLEAEVLGLFVDGHPMAVLRPRFPEEVLPTKDLASASGRRAAVAGILAARRKTRTESKKEIMEFVTLEDEFGLAECTLFPKTFRRFGGRFQTMGPYLAEGKVENRFGSATLTVERIRPVETTF
jgi:DNA-directed DNA polymerase III PolC